MNPQLLKGSVLFVVGVTVFFVVITWWSQQPETALVVPPVKPTASPVREVKRTAELVYLVDTSGSMLMDDKLDFFWRALEASQSSENRKFSLATFAGDTGQVLIQSQPESAVKESLSKGQSELNKPGSVRLDDLITKVGTKRSDGAYQHLVVVTDDVLNLGLMKAIDTFRLNGTEPKTTVLALRLKPEIQRNLAIQCEKSKLTCVFVEDSERLISLLQSF